MTFFHLTKDMPTFNIALKVKHSAMSPEKANSHKNWK